MEQIFGQEASCTTGQMMVKFYKIVKIVLGETDMLETFVLLIFAGALAACVIFGASVLYALAAGYLIFCVYGLKKGHSIPQLLQMSLSGIRTVKNILMIFGLIGLITALWRGAGTIPVIVCYSAKLVQPSAFLLIAFLLNCMVSALTGTSFGTSATMGVITMAMARALKLHPFFVGGAILSGAFFGDRCSPVSSSANLVCELTKTDIFENIRLMVKTSLVPFFLTCMLYYGIGRTMAAGNEIMDVESLFSESFILHWAAVLPAFTILVLSALKVKVKRTMACSVLLAFFLCMFLQKLSLPEIFRMMIFGYQAEEAELAALMNGGGIISMIKVTIIVSLSSCYAGIFEGTGLLNSLKARIERLSRRITSFGTTLLVSCITSLVACNQTLATMLTHQLCCETEKDAQTFAIDLENSVIVLAPLVPWSIAGAVPLAAVGAPTASILAACYLYLLPLWTLAGKLCRMAAAKKQER